MLVLIVGVVRKLVNGGIMCERISKLNKDVADADNLASQTAYTEGRSGGENARRLRVFMVAFLTSTLLALTAFLNAPVAKAASEVCVAGRDVAYTCNYTKGHGGYVSVVTTIFQEITKTNVCDYSSDVRVSAHGNRTYRFWHKGSGQNCSFARAWLDFPVNETYPTGSSYVCVINYIKGVQQGRQMCIKLT
jgi:hypothetical protein